MANPIPSGLKEKLFFLGCLLFLTLGFYNNFWKAADQGFYSEFDKSSESLILGRLGMSEREGLFAHGGLTGRFPTPEGKDSVLYQYEVYEDQLEVETDVFHTYDSQTGGQAITFALIDIVSPLSNQANVQLYKLLNSALAALVFLLIVFWVYQNFGFGTALITFIFILFSQGITVFARHLYWSLWAFYVPFLAVLAALLVEKRKDIQFSASKMIGLVFLAVLVKFFYTGFEYITTTLIMLVTPFVFYAILDKWPFRKLVNRVLYSAVGSIAAALMSSVFIVLQISAVKGSLASGVDHIVGSFLRRSWGDPNNFSDTYRASLESSIPEVLGRYLIRTPAPPFDLQNIFVNFSGADLWKMNYGGLIFLFAAFSVLYFMGKKYDFIDAGDSKKQTALILTCWVSILAPLSWLILFKGHSYIHRVLNYIVWYMPFAILGFAVISSVIMSMKTRAYQFLSVAGIFLVFFVSDYQEKQLGRVVENYNQVQEIRSSALLHQAESGFSIYAHQDRIWYVKEAAQEQDREATFFLEFIPADRSAVQGETLEFDYRSGSIQFPWWTGKGKLLIVSQPLPSYAIDEIRTGQQAEGTSIWQTRLVIEN